ncbi:MFS transporter [Membranicola marinus]|uniref:MFS transporter n=1 Tax=Membranihabitans marinus TaxID=1227546 RepID=A0A953LBR0_9BACT|nr:MFS transporter [Membranihabitans marinus]MBY5958781.1 MFS transporter [Membranihabitans marinus]
MKSVAETNKPKTEPIIKNNPTTSIKGVFRSYRWRICALLFLATSINYLDRSVLSILAPTLQEEIGWTEIEYSYIVSAFQLAYGISVVGMGQLIDRFGVKWFFPLAVGLWSLAGIGHAFARSVSGFALARFSLGVGEASNFPAAIKTVAEWFPEKERAIAAGVFNAGSSVGAILAPLMVPWLALNYGWKSAFIVTGMLGFIWIILWRLVYREPAKHPRITKEELDYIESGQEVTSTDKISWFAVLRKRETIVVCLVRFLSDPTWWFLLFWLPKYLYQEFGITLENIGAPMITIYLIADLGSVGGGWLSSRFISMGRSINFSRKAALLICAVCVVPVILVSQISSFYVAIALISLAAAAHMGWIANVYTVISDLFPQRAIGSVTGLSTMSAVLGGLVYSSVIGYVLEATGSYLLIFVMSGFMYVTAWMVLMIGIPEIKKLKVEKGKLA